MRTRRSYFRRFFSPLLMASARGRLTIALRLMAVISVSLALPSSALAMRPIPNRAGIEQAFEVQPSSAAGPSTEFVPSKVEGLGAGAEERLVARPGQAGVGILVGPGAAALVAGLELGDLPYAVVVERAEHAAGLEALGVPRDRIFVITQAGAEEAYRLARVRLVELGATIIRVVAILGQDADAFWQDALAFLREMFEPISATVEAQLRSLVLEAQSRTQA